MLFMAATIFFVGAGVTIVNLCCSGCTDTVLSIASSGDERNSHHMESAPKADSCCSSKGMESSECPSHSENSCSIERISIDIYNAIYKPDLSGLLVWSATPLHYGFTFLSSVAENHIQPDVKEHIPIPPRDYLSLIRILII